MSDRDWPVLRWIAFDAGGTLISPDPPAPAVYAATARRFGSRLSAGEIAARFDEAFRAAELAELEDLTSADWSRPDVLTTSEDRERERWRQIVAHVIDDVEEPVECFHELFAHFARPESWRCYDDVGETLRTLSSRGCRLAVISNYDDRLNAICDGLPEFRPIELRVISSHVGCRKPSARFYAALASAAGSRPDELLVVGDDLVNDVEGARAAGLHALLLDRSAGPVRKTAGVISSLRELLDYFPPPPSLSPGRPGPPLAQNR
ncbi:MAG TPA: HAD-IA family hydrolase [Planctomycetaceae bacterium]|nr:HAD-IA family hydrolase [Planctomycetaceae bacterium]